MENDYKNRRIIWLASYPKSGNTWVRMFVNAYISGFSINLNSAFQFATSDVLPYAYQRVCDCKISDLDHTWMPYIRFAALANMLIRSHTRDICLKTHFAKLSGNGIPLIPKELSRCALYIVRDPRDLVCSLASYMNKSIDQAIEMMADEKVGIKNNEEGLHQFMSSWSIHVDSWTVNNEEIPTEVIRYEDMVLYTKDTFELILRALGIETIIEDKFNFALEETCFDNLRRKEDKTGFREQRGKGKFFRKGKIGAWKEELTDSQVRSIEETHRETMDRFAYFEIPELVQV